MIHGLTENQRRGVLLEKAISIAPTRFKVPHSHNPYGDASLVVPLTNIEPFFVFIFAYIFLRELEKITYKLIIETLIIVTSVSLITIFWREINARNHVRAC